MRKRLGCLHAHYSNIEYMDNAFSAYNLELIHFIEPGLMYRAASDENFQESDAQRKVNEQIEWMAQCGVDAILITCTNYIAFLKEDQLSTAVPIIKMDEPYFDSISKIDQPQVILFSNPATVKGTMERLRQYTDHQQKCLDIEVMVINETFDLIMRGLKDEYNQKVSESLHQVIKDNDKAVSVAQLSMVDAAYQVEEETSKKILPPLYALIPFIVNQLELETK